MEKRSWVRGGCVGRGSFGSVSLAFDRSTGNVFAVKSTVVCSDNAFSEHSVRSLENEVSIYRSLDSPYLLSYLGDDFTRESSGDVFRNLYLEYMPNGTLADVVKKSGGGSVAECDLRSYTRCLTEALRYLHEEGIVHGDVKGRNVLVGHTPGSVKLADFGSATRLSDRNRTEVRQGTPLWMAPEVVRGEPHSPKSDVWSLGCTVVEMVTGEAPWAKQRCETPETTLFRIGFGEEVPEISQKMSESGRDFVSNCLKRNPEERWACEELLRHPFLAEVETKQSPRSVFGLIGSEFGFDEDYEEEEEEKEETDWNTSHNRTVPSLDAQTRIGGLAAGGPMAEWDDDDGGEQWEFVRGGESEEIHIGSGSNRPTTLLSRTEPFSTSSDMGQSSNNSCGGERVESDTGFVGDRIVWRLCKEKEALGLLLLTCFVTCYFMWTWIILHIICNLSLLFHLLSLLDNITILVPSFMMDCFFVATSSLPFLPSCCAFCGSACEDKDMELPPQSEQFWVDLANKICQSPYYMEEKEVCVSMTYLFGFEPLTSAC